ncbi:MAG TPA: FAD-dependent oxidoreductase, partial [Egibacteraceae bacterium]|nr:FAD-dependent oxidoreductase [Egibacteraceae bacterium]
KKPPMSTIGSSVTAAHAVIATLLPIVDIGGFFAKAHPTRSYGIAVRLSAPPPEGMHISVDAPTRSTRPWRGAEHGMVVVGESHKTGHGDDLDGHYRALEQWAREHFAVTEVSYRWSAQDYRPVDELPYVGRCPRTERVYVGTGFMKWGLSNGTAAGAMIADLIGGRDTAWLPAFDASRAGVSDAQAAKTAVRENLEVGKRFVADRVGRLSAEDLGALSPGEGGIVRVGDKAVAAYRDPDGGVHAVSPTCTHLGCTVSWNDAERSWDCPCHGSRFSVEGAVLDGPAVSPLEPYEVED